MYYAYTKRMANYLIENGCNVVKIVTSTRIRDFSHLHLKEMTIFRNSLRLGMMVKASHTRKIKNDACLWQRL